VYLLGVYLTVLGAPSKCILSVHQKPSLYNPFLQLKIIIYIFELDKTGLAFETYLAAMYI